MFGRVFAGVAALLVCTFATSQADARFWQCVPYARMVSGVDLRGTAPPWWNEAAGR